MAEVFLTPQDVSSRDAALVLAFLNQAQSPQEIADRVEIPNEPDIGIKLAQRILNARAQQNGAFDGLDQVYAVPLIGPDRFTELVVCVTGKSEVELLLAGKTPTLAGDIHTVSQQLDFLRNALDELAQFDPRRYRIDISTADTTPYLGEIINLRVRVFDRVRNTAQANMPVSLETNWGFLRYAKGYQIQTGAVISVRTGVSGEFFCELHTPTLEPLDLAQQTELSTALSNLGNAKLLPMEMAEGFNYITGLYQHPLNRDLRAAIDIHYKSRQARIADTVNHQAPLHSWLLEHALVRCYLHPYEESEKSTVLAIAALPIEYRDWLLPWFYYFKDNVMQAGALNKALQQALKYSANEKGLANQMLAGMQTFIAGFNGVVGERMAQQISQDVTTTFVTSNLDKLTSATQTTLLTLLKEAPTSIKSGSAGQIGVATEVAVDVGRNQGVYDFSATLAGVTGQLGQLENQLSAMDTRVTSVNSRLSSFETATANVNFNQLTADLGSFNTRYADFNNHYTSFTTDYTAFETSFNNFNLNLNGFNSQLNSFNTNLNGFNQSLTSFNLAKDQLLTNVTNGVNAALRTLESNNTTRVTIQPIANVNLNRMP